MDYMSLTELPVSKHGATLAITGKLPNVRKKLETRLMIANILTLLPQLPQLYYNLFPVSYSNQ